MNKKVFIISGIIIVTIFLFMGIFNKLVPNDKKSEIFTEVKKGLIEISITATGELIAENSIEIKGPEIVQRREIQSRDIRIQDLVPEGTIVKEGDYVATLDRTEFDNTLKDIRERLTSLQTDLEIALLDSSIIINGIMDEISNQKHIVEEATIALRNSKYEPATAIRQAEIELDKAKRVLEQKERSYTLKMAQTHININNLKYWISRITKRVDYYEELLSKFTVTAPASGMITYRRGWHGNKRKIGSTINPFDRVIAILPDLSSMVSKVYVSEIEVSKIKQGQKANIKVDAFPEKVYTGSVISVANIGEQLPNTDSKVFEVQIKIDGSDPRLRPSMTTGNKLIIRNVNDALFVPAECVQAGTDSIPFVYTKNRTKQIVILGEATEKNIIIKQGLEPGTSIYLTPPAKAYKFKLSGEELIPLIRNGNKQRDKRLARLKEKYTGSL